MRNNQKSFTRYHSAPGLARHRLAPGFAHLFLLFFVILVAIGTIGYLAYQNSQLKQYLAQGKSSSPSTPSPTVTKTLTECEPCPQFTPPSPDWCKDGKVIRGEVDKCGCQGPPKCEYGNWENYETDTYTLKIPPDWDINEVKNNAADVIFVPPIVKENPRVSTISILVISPDKQGFNNSMKTPEQFELWLSKSIEDGAEKREYKIAQIKVGDLTGIQIARQTLPGDQVGVSYSITTWFRKEGLNYYMSISPEKETVEQLLPTYNQILSTFKFTE